MTRAKKEYNLGSEINQMTGGLSTEVSRDKIRTAMSCLEKRFTEMQAAGT